MKYFEITNNKNAKISDILLSIFGDFLSSDPFNIIDLINVDEDTTISRNNKTEYISEVDESLLYYNLIKEELYSCIDDKAEKAPDNITVVDDLGIHSEIVDIDTNFTVYKSTFLNNFVKNSKKSTLYLKVVDSTKILCIDINDKGIIVINFNENNKFNFDIFPSVKTNRTIYYIDIDNSAVENDPESNSRDVLCIIGSLFNSICEQFPIACIYNGYYRVIPLIVFGEYLYNVCKTYNDDYSVTDGIMHSYAYNKFNIPNFLKFYYEDGYTITPCNIIKFLSEQEKIIHEYPVRIYSVKYHDDSSKENLIKNLHKAMKCAIIYGDDIFDHGTINITEALDDEDICAIFIFYHGEKETDDIKEFANSISHDHINLITSDDNLIIESDKTYNIALDEFAPYNLLNLVPEIKSKFDADHKNGIPKTIEEYKENPMGNPVPMVVDEPVRNSFVHKNK